MNCLDGCDECDNPVCDCQVIVFYYSKLPVSMSKIHIKVVEQNEDWNRCIDDNSLTLGRCVYNCQNNEQCEDDCVARFKTRQLDCPCEVIF